MISTAEAQAPPGARAGQAAGKKDWASNLTPRHPRQYSHFVLSELASAECAWSKTRMEYDGIESSGTQQTGN